MADNNLTNIQAYQKKWHFNIGLVIFGVIFVYLTVTILMYLTENHISAYEVREGSILYDRLISQDKTGICIVAQDRSFPHFICGYMIFR